jgi:hypothetical protein
MLYLLLASIAIGIHSMLHFREEKEKKAGLNPYIYISKIII